MVIWLASLKIDKIVCRGIIKILVQEIGRHPGNSGRYSSSRLPHQVSISFRFCDIIGICLVSCIYDL